MNAKPLLLLAGLLCAGTVSAATKVWVASAGTKLMGSAAATAPVVAPLGLGAELEVLSTQGSWLQVTTRDGKRGWVFRGKIASTPPAPASGGGLFAAAGKSSIQVAGADTARSIRGLSPEAEQYAESVQAAAAHRKAVDDMLALKVSETELNQFLKEGKIGEYASD